MKKIISIAQTRWCWLAVAIALIVITTANVPVKSAESIDPDATQILQSMSSYMAETKAFSVDTDIDFEVVAKNGQKLKFISSGKVVLQRPNKFQIRRKGTIADAEFLFDGETLTVYGKKNNVYAQFNVSGTIDDAIRAFELNTGIPTPGADLLFNDVYTILSSGVESSTYVGTTQIDGIECHHLAFREAEVDWQLWVQAGDTPLPMRYTITSKWVTGAPQYEIRLHNWNTNPQINDQQFTFLAPPGATQLETIPINELDEFTPTPEE